MSVNSLPSNLLFAIAAELGDDHFGVIFIIIKGGFVKLSNLIMLFVMLMPLIAIDAKAALVIQGLYKSNCYLQNDDAISEQINVSQNHLGQTKWNHTYLAYEDQDCSKAYLKYEINYSAQFSNSKNEVRSVTEDADFKVQSVVYTALTKSVAHSLNYIAFCGYSKWTEMTPVDVTGLVCQDVQQLPKDHIVYSTAKFNLDDANSSDIVDIISIQIGQSTQDEFGETPETRLKQLSEPYLK